MAETLSLEGLGVRSRCVVPWVTDNVDQLGERCHHPDGWGRGRRSFSLRREDPFVPGMRGRKANEARVAGGHNETRRPTRTANPRREPEPEERVKGAVIPRAGPSIAPESE